MKQICYYLDLIILLIFPFSLMADGFSGFLSSQLYYYWNYDQLSSIRVKPGGSHQLFMILYPYVEYDKWIYGEEFDFYGDVALSTRSISLNFYSEPEDRKFFDYASLVTDLRDRYGVEKILLGVAFSGKLRFFVGRDYISLDKSHFLDESQMLLHLSYTDPLSVFSNIDGYLIKFDPEKFYDPKKKSYILSFAGTFNFPYFEVSPSFVFFKDRDNLVANFVDPYLMMIYLQMVKERRARYDPRCGIPEHIVTKSSSSLYLPALNVDFEYRNFNLTFFYVLETGDINLNGYIPVRCSEENPQGIPVSSSPEVLSQIVEVVGKYNIDNFQFKGKFLRITGDSSLLSDITKSGEVNSFLALLPYERDTIIFFNGGMSSNLYGSNMQFAGRFGSGVREFLVSGSYTWGVNQLSLVYSYLLADSVNQRVGGNLYGNELDLNFTRQLTDALELEAEGAVFMPGNFFPDETRSIYEAGTGVNFNF